MAEDSTKLIISIETILRGLDKTLRGLAQVEKQLKTVASIKVAGQSASTGFDRATTAALKLQQQQQKLQIQTQELANREERARLTAERLAATRDRLAKATERAAKAERVSAPKAAAADAHVREFRAREKEAKRAQREIDRVNAKASRDASASAKQQERIATQLANHQIKEAKRAQRVAAGTERGKQGGGAFFGGSLLGFAGAGPAASAVGVALGLTIFNLTSRLTEGGRAWLDYASKVQNARIAFTTMLGGVADADAHLRDLQKFALETPFAFDELIDASQRMQALGFNAKEVIPILRDVGNAVAAAGGGGERLERVIKALSDVRARGTLQSQEIRQFAEAGISAFQILQEETGKTTVELQDMVEKGQISADFFIRAFQKFSQVHFGDLMEQQSKTFLGALSNIRDVLLQLATKAFEPLFTKISEISVRVQAELQKVKDLDQAADVLGEAFVELGGFLAEKIAEGIVARMASPRFLIKGLPLVQLVKNLKTSLLSFGTEFQNTIAELATGRTRGETTASDLLKADEKRTKGLKGITAASQAAKAQTDALATAEQQAADVAKKSAEIYVDLVQKLGDVSSVSLELATWQQLLRAGVTDLNSGYAALAISLAQAADAQKNFNEQQEAEAKRVRERNQSLREQLEATRDSMRLSILEVQAAPEGLPELDRFNATLGAQVEGVLEAARATGVWNDELQGLADALKLTREQIQQFDTVTANVKKQEEDLKLLKQRAELTRSLFEMQRELAQTTFEFDSGQNLTELQRVAEQITSLFGTKLQPDAFDPLLELFDKGEAGAVTMLTTVQTILETVRGDLGPAFDDVVQSIVNAFNAAQKLDVKLREAAERAGELSRLTIKLRTEEERIQDRVIDGIITERQAREEIRAVQQKYREEILKILEVELALAKLRTGPQAAAEVAQIEAQIEATKRLGKVIDEAGQQINRDLFSTLQSGFENVFNSAIDGIDSVKDALKDLGRSLLAVINRVAAETLVEELFGGILKPDSGNTQGTIGGFLAKIFGIGPKESPAVAQNTTATDANTAAIDRLTGVFGGLGAGAAGVAGGVGIISPEASQAISFGQSIIDAITGSDKGEAGQPVTAQQGSTVIDAINIASGLLAQILNSINALTVAIGGKGALAKTTGGASQTANQLVNFGTSIVNALASSGEDGGGGFSLSGFGGIFEAQAQKGTNLIDAININSDETKKNTQALKDNTQAQGGGGQSFSQFASLFGEAASGDLVQAHPRGRLVRVAEAGHDEAILTTDPKHANRQMRILREYLHRTKGLFGRIPEFAAGGMVTPREAEMNLLSSIQRAPTFTPSTSEIALAGGGRARNFRAIFVDDQRGVKEWLNSPEGDEVWVQQLTRNRSRVKRLLK